MKTNKFSAHGEVQAIYVSELQILSINLTGPFNLVVSLYRRGQLRNVAVIKRGLLTWIKFAYLCQKVP